MNIFPCCSSAKNLDAQKDENICSHVITTLVVAILLGAAAATTTYFFAEQNLMWTAVAGGGAFVLAGCVTYAALHCLYGQSKPETSAKPKPIPKPAPQPNPSPKLNVTVPEIVLRAQKDRNPARCIKMNHELLADLEPEMNEQFSQNVRAHGVVYYDPINELPIPLVRLYQEMLCHPEFSNKIDVLRTLFAEELALMSDKAISEDAIKAAITPYISSLSKTEVIGVGNCVNMVSKPREDLVRILQRYGNEKPFYDTARGYNEIMRQLNTDDTLDPPYYFGVALHDGACFFHTVAQLLNTYLGTKMTEKKLRGLCVDKMLTNNDGKMTPEMQEMLSSSREIEEHNLKHPTNKKTASWGEYFDVAPIIADLFGVELRLYKVHFEQKEVRKKEKRFDESTGTTEKIPAIWENDVVETEFATTQPLGKESSGIIRLAHLKDHFFPIWTN